MPTDRFPRFPRLATAALLLSGVITPHAIAAPPAAAILYVDQMAAGTGTGSSWTNAYPDLHDALTEAATIASPTAPVEIWVAQGLYQPDRGTGDRLGMYQVPAYTELYGGFAGTEVLRTQRDWHAHPTILDGDLLGNDDPDFIPTSDCCSLHAAPGCDNAVCQARVIAIDERCDNPHPFNPVWGGRCVDLAMQECCDLCRPSRCDNTYRLINVADGTGVVIDGFTVQKAEASGYQLPGIYSTFLATRGAGILVHAGDIIIRNCTFTRDAASSAATIALESAAPALIEFCLFERNESLIPGSSAIGIASSNSTRILRDCVARHHQGAFIATSSAFEIRRCTFFDIGGIHSSSGALIADSEFIGGGPNARMISLQDKPSTIINCNFINIVGGICPAISALGNVTVANCSFIGNTATEGAGIACLGGFILGGSTLINSVFVGNRTKSGGAVTGSPLTMYNTILWGNRDDDPATTLLQEQVKPPSSGPQHINYSIIEGWDGSLGGVDNSGLDPLFVDPLGPDMLPATGDENYRLSFDSPAIDAGHPNPPLLAVRDLDGHHRTLCAATDLGPYEFGIADPDCDGDTDLSDYFALPACLTGPIPAALPVSCHPFDFDADNAVDLSDLAGFQNTFQTP